MAFHGPGCQEYRADDLDMCPQLSPVRSEGDIRLRMRESAS